MGNKIINHTSRYSGPSGDSRPPREIFDGIEHRARQSQEALSKLSQFLDNTLETMTLSSHQGAVESIKNTFIEWWIGQDIDVKEELEANLRRNEEKNMNKKPLSQQDLRTMAGKPVYCPEMESYGIVKCETKGRWAGIPFLIGAWHKNGVAVNFEYNIYRKKFGMLLD